jgi:nucleoporin NUP159
VSVHGRSLIYPLTPFRAPSLDTVNRTSRNINLAIRQQSVDVSSLSSRIAKLNLEGGSPSGTPSRRERDILRRPLDVTPHVASTTAAALNAEQAAHRLKEALLAVRAQPLLNTQAANAKPAMRVFDTPQKLPDANLGSSGGSFGGGIFSTPLPLPQLNASESAGKGASPPVSAGRRSTTTQKYHAKSVPLKSTPTTGTTPKHSFDWGPLPGIKPMTTIASDLRSKT